MLLASHLATIWCGVICRRSGMNQDSNLANFPGADAMQALPLTSRFESEVSPIIGYGEIKHGIVA